MIEQFSVAEACTPSLTFAEDLAVYVDAEVGGIGISESKLGPGGDAGTLAEFYATGLRATLAVPRVHCILPGPLSPGPADPAARIEQMCASVRRLAAFDPVAIGVQTGPAGTHTPAEARALIVHALRDLARTATSLHPRGFQVALEPVAPAWAGDGWIATSLAEAAELIEEAGEPNLQLVLDTWHLADVPEQDIERFGDRIAVVQLADRAQTDLTQTDLTQADRARTDRARTDRALPGRALPGHATTNVARVVRALTGLRYSGWYELEVPAGSDVATDSARLPNAAAFVRTAQQEFRDLHRNVAGVPAH